MAKIFAYLKNFILEDFSFRYYFLVSLFLAVSISLNYYFEIEDIVIEGQSNHLIRFVFYFLLYSIAYLGTLLLLFLVRNKNYFSDKEVMIKSFLAFAILAIDGTYSFSTDFFKTYFSSSNMEAFYLHKIGLQVLPAFIYFSSLLLIRKKFDPQSPNLYGLSAKGFDWYPYLIMLCIMLPLIAIISFQPDFTAQYPTFRYWQYTSIFGLSQKQLFAIYEFLYIFDFINVEILFRGLLVIGVMKIMGKDAILPMVVMYVFLHFGKPPAETIGSIFGGYILGILAFRTNSILGGILIHAGTALLMDICAVLQR